MKGIIREKKIAVRLTEQEKENLSRLLDERRQPLNEFLIMQLTLILRSSSKVNPPKRRKVIKRTERVDIRVSLWLYNEIQKKADESACSVSSVVYKAILKGLRS